MTIVSRFSVALRPTARPQLVTVAGEKGIAPAPLVMNPGSWMITIKTNKEVMIVSTSAASIRNMKREKGTLLLRLGLREKCAMEMCRASLSAEPFPPELCRPRRAK